MLDHNFEELVKYNTISDFVLDYVKSHGFVVLFCRPVDTLAGPAVKLRVSYKRSPYPHDFVMCRRILVGLFDDICLFYFTKSHGCIEFTLYNFATNFINFVNNEI